MVGTGQPQGAVALHPLEPDENILQCIIQSMAQMQLTRDVRRRHHDAVRLFVMVDDRGKVSFFLPEGIKSILK